MGRDYRCSYVLDAGRAGRDFRRSYVLDACRVGRDYRCSYVLDAGRMGRDFRRSYVLDACRVGRDFRRSYVPHRLPLNLWPCKAILDPIETVKVGIRRGACIFGVMNCVFHDTKVRYRGLKKNFARITSSGCPSICGWCVAPFSDDDRIGARKKRTKGAKLPQRG